MDYALVAVSGLLLVFPLFRGAPSFFKLARRSVSLLDIYMLKGEEDDKLPIIERRTGQLLVSLLAVIGILILAVGLSIGLLLASDEFFQTDSFSLLNSGWGMLIYSVTASIPFFIPKKSKSAYTPLAQLLHHLALDNYNVGYRLFKRESKRNAQEEKAHFVVVTGLARAGTTSVLNTAMPLGPFASLNYGNMPFLMAPNTWAKFYKPKKGKEVERSHGDGISIGLDSNEALEEYFYKVIFQDAYIRENRLVQHQLTGEQYADVMKYQSIVRKAKSDVYIAKNNNFLLRYKSMREHNPDFIAIVMYRHPLYHAASLLEKHLQYVKMQEEDPFVLEYMNWLGHHEFGKNHLPFEFDGIDAHPGMNGYNDPTTLNYWLTVWLTVYSYAATIADRNTHFVSYDDFCANPIEALRQPLSSIPGINLPAGATGHVNKREVSASYDEELMKEAEEVYHVLGAKY